MAIEPTLLLLVVYWHLSSFLCRAQLNIQSTGIKQSALAKSRAEQIKSAFTLAFDDYMKYGFPSDEVMPVSKLPRNTRNGWSASLVDALDTLFVMGLEDRFKQGVAHTLKIDFTTSKTTEPVSLFEATIRHIGGMLAAYELSGATDTALLDQARKLGDKLLIAWPDEHQNLPFRHLDFAANKPDTDDFISAAAAGSLIVEFDRLSFHTGEPKYLQHATKAMKAIMRIPSHLPGLPGFRFGVKNETVLADTISWGAGVDSYLEYLLKYGMLIKDQDPSYYKAWQLAVKTSISHLIQVSGNSTYLSDFSSSQGGLNYEFSHLGCFASGNWILGGKVLKDNAVFEYGLKLLATCMNTYQQTQSGLGPEIFRFLGPNGEHGPEKPSAEEQVYFKKHGFYIANSMYKLRPEVIESAFYAWRLTGDTKYQDFAWNFFQSLQKWCKSNAAYSDIADVETFKIQVDAQESFLYAETFKYLYLIFADPQVLSLDQYVFSTEAHPFRLQSSKNRKRCTLSA